MFSIVVATRDRAASLRRLLGAIAQQDHTPGYLEYVVVDNGSTDDTRDVTAEFARVAGNPVRYVSESRQGLALARNMGAERASGRLLVFVDDDILPTEGWLDAFRDLASSDPGLAVAGGKIEPKWPDGQPPSWLPERYMWLYGRLDYGPASRLLEPSEQVNGGNLMVSRAVLLESGGFDCRLGHQGEQLGGSEEQDLLARIRNQLGTHCYYAGAALAHHVIPLARIEKQWALQRLRAGSMHIAVNERRHRSRSFLLAKRLYYKTILAYAKVGALNELRLVECDSYLAGLRQPERPPEL